MYGFLRRPLWLLSHVLIAALVVLLIALGFWQRSRYFEERYKSQQLQTIARAAPVSLNEVISDSGTAPSKVPEKARYRRVKVAGKYDSAHEVSILNRSRGGAPGAWVLTPLVQADGTAVPVVRGWIPLQTNGEKPPFPGSEAPTGNVTVTGNLQLTQQRGSFGSTDPKSGTLTALSRVDLDRFEAQLPYKIEPAWVLLDGQNPEQADGSPAVIELQTKDPSQNFSYMMQWWIFALIALCGYPLVLRMVARNKAKGDQTPADPSLRGGDSDEIPWAAGLGPNAEGELSP
ncbi:MAG: SURF1 family protein [Actinomycetes bacterium]